MIDVDHSYELDPRVALRPERFGALAYHYGTRRLVFIKTSLLTVLEHLPSSTSLEAAFEHAGIPRGRWAAFVQALTSLEESGVVRAKVVATHG